METIVFISTNKSGSSREAIKAAERLGYFTVLLTNRQKFIEQRLEFPDVGEMILTDLSCYSTLKKKIKNLKKQGKVIKAILSFVDPYVSVAADLMSKFCENEVPSDCFINMEDKILTRELLKSFQASPYFDVYNHTDLLEDFISKQTIHYPLIVKSPVSAGSKDVFFVENQEELKSSMEKLINKYKNTPILLEEYLIGPQYLVEIVVENGVVNIVAVVEQEITFTERFIVTGYNLDPYIDLNLYNGVFETVNSIVRAFNLKNGACHLEMRLVEGEWKLIEVNPRISGGAMNRIIEEAYGINLVEETIKLYLGEKPNLTKNRNKYVYVHYMTSAKQGSLIKVTGKGRASRIPGVQEVYIKPKKGQILRPPVSMGARCGYVLAVSDIKGEAKDIALEASKEISFAIESN
jgi:biotin carboxylase